MVGGFFVESRGGSHLGTGDGSGGSPHRKEIAAEGRGGGGRVGIEGH